MLGDVTALFVAEEGRLLAPLKNIKILKGHRCYTQVTSIQSDANEFNAAK